MVLYVCMYVFMYVYMYVCMYVYIYMCVCMCVYLSVSFVPVGIPHSLYVHLMLLRIERYLTHSTDSRDLIQRPSK